MWKESHANNVSDVNMSHNDKNTWLLLLLPSNKAAKCRQTACSTQRQEAPLARKTLQEKNIMQITSAQKKVPLSVMSKLNMSAWIYNEICVLLLLIIYSWFHFNSQVIWKISPASHLHKSANCVLDLVSCSHAVLHFSLRSPSKTQTISLIARWALTANLLKTTVCSV